MVCTAEFHKGSFSMRVLTVLTVFTGLARRVHNASSGFAKRILFTGTICDIFPVTLAHTMYIKVPASKQGIPYLPLHLPLTHH